MNESEELGNTPQTYQATVLPRKGGPEVLQLKTFPIEEPGPLCASVCVQLFYGITKLYRKKPELFREDLPKIFALVAQKKIAPPISAIFPLLEANKALEMLATGSVQGKIVLTNGQGPTT